MPKSNLARPKRAAESFARSHNNNNLQPQSSATGNPKSTSASTSTVKKPRFDIRNPSALAPEAPEEGEEADAVLEADVIGSRGGNVRRNAVNIDGYDSDSENEGFDGQAEMKAKARKKEEEEEEVAKRKAAADEDADEDMFAESADEDAGVGKSSKTEDAEGGGGLKEKAARKAVRFLNADEIEGQVANSHSGGHISASILGNKAKSKAKATSTTDIESSSSDSEVDDETRATNPAAAGIDEEIGAGGKKKHAPQLDAFNMRSEVEDGQFDDQGNYVRKAADPDAVHDSWLEGTSRKDMKKAKEAAERRDEERLKREEEQDAVLTGDVLARLIPFLETGETVLEALARLNKEGVKGKGKGEKKKPRWQTKSKNRKKADTGDERGDVDMGGAEEDPAEAKRKATVEAITEAADLLMSRDQPEIYDAERELLIRQYTRETGEKWVEPANKRTEKGAGKGRVGSEQWEYRWSDARDGGEIHGPYEGETMKQWNEAGYFGEGVEFRKTVTSGQGDWSRVAGFI